MLLASGARRVRDPPESAAEEDSMGGAKALRALRWCLSTPQNLTGTGISSRAKGASSSDDRGRRTGIAAVVPWSGARESQALGISLRLPIGKVSGVGWRRPFTSNIPDSSNTNTMVYWEELCTQQWSSSSLIIPRLHCVVGFEKPRPDLRGASPFQL